MIRVLALSGWLIAVVGGIAGLVVHFASGAAIPPNTFGLGEGSMLGFVVLGITWASCGLLIISRRPDNAIGRYMVLTGIGYAVCMLPASLAFAGMASEGDHLSPTTRVFGWLTVAVTALGGFIFFIGFIFPTGRGHTPRWDIVQRVMVIGYLIGGTVLVFQPGRLHLFPQIQNPFGIAPSLRFSPDELVPPAVLASTFLILPLMGAAIVTRYRMAGALERAQLKWFILAIVIAIGGVSVAALGVAIRQGPADEIGLLVFTWVGSLVPVAIVIAILRHGLYDIDRLISHTIAWAALSATLAALYVGSILVLQAPMGTITNGQTVAVAASTLLVATLFQPLRRRLQRVVDRRFHRARYDAERTTAAFADRVRNHVDLPSLSAELSAAVGASFEPSSFRLWLRDRPR